MPIVSDSAHHAPNNFPETHEIPFDDAEQAWFWCIQAREAQIHGARLAKGMGEAPRPCEPLDILTVVDRLYRRRDLDAAHLRVLATYGQQVLRPDHLRQNRAAKLWDEAFATLTPPLRAKGIVV
mgnify:CR=1 FL=1